MKIYFSGTTSQGKTNKKLYSKIVTYLETKGHQVFSEAIDDHLPSAKNISSHHLKTWFREWTSYTSKCDCAIIEASYPSTVHIGYEIGLLVAKGKPVVVLYQPKKEPVFINGHHSPRLIKSQYSPDLIEETLDWCLEEVKKSLDRRFTFFISPEIDTFLDKIAMDKGTSRAEFIRQLIEDKIKSG